MADFVAFTGCTTDSLVAADIKIRIFPAIVSSASKDTSSIHVLFLMVSLDGTCMANHEHPFLIVISWCRRAFLHWGKLYIGLII